MEKTYKKYFKEGEYVAYPKTFEKKGANRLPKNMVKDYENRARAEQKAGGAIKIDTRMPHIAIKMSDGSEYFLKDEEAQTLLDSVPENIHMDDFILAQAQGW